MIFVKVKSTTYSDNGDTSYNNVLRDIGIEPDGVSAYMYLNVSNCSVGPYVDDEGIDNSKCVLINTEGKAVVKLDMSPEEYVHLIEGMILLPKEIDHEDYN